MEALNEDENNNNNKNLSVNGLENIAQRRTAQHKVTSGFQNL